MNPPIVTDIKARRSIVMKDNRCFVCLKIGHRAINCRLQYECIKCKQRHHVTLCSNNTQDNSNTNFRHAQRTVTHQISNSDNSSNVILQSDTSLVPHPSKESIHIPTRILFDGCRQRTYKTDSLRKRLNLRTIRTENLVIKRFATDEGLVKTLDVVQICIKGKTRNVNIYLEALCMPHISSPVSNPDFKIVKSKYPYLQGLQFAENFPNERINDVEILVGLDYYYLLITDKTVRGPPNGPVAIESILGWIICGPTDLKSGTNITRVNLIHTRNVHLEERDTLRDDL